MNAVVDEPLVLDVLDVVFCEGEASSDAPALRKNTNAVLSANRQAAVVDDGDLAAFLDFLSGADADYIGAAAYVAEPAPAPLDWEAVSQALGESQGILIAMQNLLSATLEAMGIEDHESVRVYADMGGDLRLVSDHPRLAEIEARLNSPENADLRVLYHAAMDGMSLAGGLVGTMAVPEEVLERVKAKHSAA